MKSDDSFDHARKNANPDCPKCKGTGGYMYDHNHGKICEVCCKHDRGWWKLEEHYGSNNGKWCCTAGCGEVLDEQNGDHSALISLLADDAETQQRPLSLPN